MGIDIIFLFRRLAWRTPGGGGVFVLARNRKFTVHRIISPFNVLFLNGNRRTNQHWTYYHKTIIREHMSWDGVREWGVVELIIVEWSSLNVAVKNNHIYRALLNVRLTWKITTKNIVIFVLSEKFHWPPWMTFIESLRQMPFLMYRARGHFSALFLNDAQKWITKIILFIVLCLNATVDMKIIIDFVIEWTSNVLLQNDYPCTDVMK